MIFENFEYKVITNFILTREELDHLIKVSHAHYDSKCQSASEIGGFIYGWKNMLFESSEVSVSMTIQQMDLITKILECENYIKDRKITMFQTFCEYIQKTIAESERINCIHELKD